MKYNKIMAYEIPEFTNGYKKILKAKINIPVTNILYVVASGQLGFLDFYNR